MPGVNQLSAVRENPSKAAVELAAILLLSFLASAGSWQLVTRFPRTLRRDRRIALAAFLFAGGLSAGAFAVVLLHDTSDDAAIVGSTPPEQRALPGGAPIKRVILLTVDTLRKDSLTAYNPDVHGINHNFPTIPPRFKTLAELMGAAGYQTAAIGSQPQLLGIGRGFDTYRLGPDPASAHDQTTAGRLLNRLARRKWTTEVITDLAIRWLDEHQREDFFLWLHWLEPHIPYEPLKAYLPRSPLVEQMGSAFVGGSSVHTGRAIRTPSEREWLRELYAAEVRYTDAALGRVLEHLQKLGLYDDSLVIFTSDHGEEFWDHGHWDRERSRRALRPQWGCSRATVLGREPLCSARARACDIETTC